MNHTPAGLITAKGKTFIRPERCEKCLFASILKNNQFECRAHPPHPTVFLLPPPKMGMPPVQQIITVFPIVTGEHWCGEFKSKVVQ